MAGKKMKKKKKKKKVRISVGSSKPSEKSVFKEKVAELEKALGSASRNLKEEEASLEQLKSKHNEEVESKRACVEHLKRVLEEAAEDMIGIQHRLQWVRDLTELTEQRAADLCRNLQSSHQLKRSVFMQQRMELEEKLSRLEEVRLKRTSQLTHLKRLEGNLEEKISTELKAKHQDNRTHVNRLLKKRQDFAHYVNSICSDANEAFELSLPVYAKNQLEENIRLRAECQEASENLLAVQDRSRRLKGLQKTLDLELETQKSAETRLNDLQARLQGHQNRLLEKSVQLQSTHNIGREDLKDIQSAIRKNQRKIARTIDKILNVEEILRDQDHYSNTLVDQVKMKTDTNGLRMSKILRAGQILKAKVREVKDEKSCMDLDLLKQMHMLLDDD
ncbi:hypothetical protein AVEN_126304-1 [Araneus ventricosus]|uniref:Uncharacterized protein n=1 Tax=Araneus ventricosus TaxID=182803 RepID=A0A4Y2I2L2_ARAVE|nr:hypothetical protein AVEN_126304-1 [Araneus ventricosus]